MIYVFDMTTSEAFQFETKEEMDTFLMEELADDEGNIDPAEMENIWIIEGKEIVLSL